MLNPAGKSALLAVWLLAVTVSSSSSSAATIHALEQWYQERPEQEVILQGTIEQQEQVLGPEARGGLLYLLVTSESKYPIYVANDAEKLAPFEGENVVVHGKTVNLEGEGRSVELWIGRIHPIEH